MTIARYPLQWPEGWGRRTDHSRKSGKFSTKRHSLNGTSGRALSVSDGVERVLGELSRLGISKEDCVISTNLKTRLDGLPKSDQPEPTDPGVAVYWEDRKGHRRVMAIDLYDRCADNLGAIAATLEAMRAIDRHGGAQILERAFTGFDALPAPKDWRQILEIVIPKGAIGKEDIERAYRRLANKYHPDKPGGDHGLMAELNSARARALGEVGGA